MSRLIARTLQSLRKNPTHFISGGLLAQELGISRAALWKHVGILKAHGYVIESKKATGYRLISSPEGPFPWEVLLHLHSRLFSLNIVYKNSVPSTNELAAHLALKGTGEGTVIIAEAQTRGKGRMGREWHSPPGINLYTSAVLRPSWPPTKGPFLTLAAAVAVSETLEDLYGLRPQIKWPNDILLSGKKVSGILTEMNTEQDRVNFIILGIGINVNSSVENFPPSLRDRATSVREVLGKPVNRALCTASLYDHLDECYTLLQEHSLEGIRDKWEARSSLAGKLIQVSGPGGVLRGHAGTLDSDGALLIETDDGRKERIISGDITLCS